MGDKEDIRLETFHRTGEKVPRGPELEASEC